MIFVLPVINQFIINKHSSSLVVRLWFYPYHVTKSCFFFFLLQVRTKLSEDGVAYGVSKTGACIRIVTITRSMWFKDYSTSSVFSSTADLIITPLS